MDLCEPVRPIVPAVPLREKWATALRSHSNIHERRRGVRFPFHDFLASPRLDRTAPSNRAVSTGYTRFQRHAAVTDAFRLLPSSDTQPGIWHSASGTMKIITSEGFGRRA